MLVTLFKDGEEAYVNTDHKECYENFLAHGWKTKVAKPTQPEDPQKTADTEEGEQEETPSRRKRVSPN